MKKVVPLHDDLFDFFYEALPGYEKVGQRRILLGCWGSFNDPEHATTPTRTWPTGAARCSSLPAWWWTASWSPHSLVDINLNIRILLGSSYYDDWENAETFVKTDPLGNPVDQHHPWNQTTTPRPQKRDFNGKYTWVMSPRWYDKRTGDHLALDTGGGPIARFWATALAGLVDIGYVKATGHSVKIYLPKTAMLPEVEFEWKIPKWSNAIERDRARTYFQAYAAAAALYFVEKALEELHAGRTKTWTDFKVPDEAIGCGFHEAVRGVLSHHVVIRDGKIANYHPYPPTPWNANPRDIYGTPGPYEDAVQNTPDLRGERPGQIQGHRHHARGAQLRSLPALRRPYVPGQRQDAGDAALADVRESLIRGNNESHGRISGTHRAHRRTGSKAGGLRRSGSAPRRERVAGIPHGAARSRSRTNSANRVRFRRIRRGRGRLAGRPRFS